MEQTGRHRQLDSKPDIVAAIFTIHDDHATESHLATGHEHHTHHTHHEHDQHGHQHPHLLVDVQGDGGVKRITIWCASSHSQAAKEEAGSLARLYVERIAQPVVNTGASQVQRQAKAAASRARAAVQSAETKLNSFLAEHSAILSPEKEKEAATANAPPATENESIAQQPAVPPLAELSLPESDPKPNPVWVELDERLQVLRAARQELLANQKESHPRVRDLQWQVERLEAEIALISPTVTPTTASDDVASDTEASDDAHPATALPPELVGPTQTGSDEPSPALLEELRRLRSAVAGARQKSGKAQADERRAATATQPSTAIATIVQPATIVSTRGGGASRAAVFGGGLLALFAALLIAWISQRVRQPAALISTLQIESLGVPVVATIPTGDGPELPSPQIFNPHWIVWLTFACELAVAAIAVTMLLLALADWQTAGQLMHDPLSTFGESVSRLW